MEKTKREKSKSGSNTTVDMIGEDVMQIIHSKLPAKSFASAACVSRSWNAVSRRVLSRPKLSSAGSLDANSRCAVEEVVDKVLSEPIRPQFAILCVSSFFSLPLAHSYITERLGSSIPVVTLTSRDIIGENAQSSRFGEMSYTLFDDESYRLSLTVGFVPGLKVDALPLLWSKDVLPQLCIDKFAIDISELADSISGCTSPTGIIMFGGEEVNMKPVLDKMDIAMHPETFIVGDASCGFYYRAVGDTGKFTHQKETCAGVALLFMKDPNKHCGIGDIQFHVAISPGMAPIGPTYKAASVKERYEEHSTWLSATNGENDEHIDGNTMLLDIEEQLGDYTPESDELFIGVSRTRNFFLNFEEPRWSTSMSFHEVVESDETYLCVRDCGIKTGDKFRFYYGNRFRNPLSSPCSMSKDMEKLKHDLDASADKRQVFGSFIFSCVDDDLLFTKSNVNSSPFLENFPGVSLGGTFCSEAIKRDCSSMYGQEQTRCCLHPHSIVYLVMSYMPPQLGDHI